MPKYEQYPTVADTPNRKMRKSKRKTIFANNRAAGAVARKARRLARKENANA